MSVFTLRSVGAFAAAVALAAPDAGAQDQADPPRPLIQSPAATEAGVFLATSVASYGYFLVAQSHNRDQDS